MIDPETVAQLRKQREWIVFENHLNQTIDALDTVDDIKGDAQLMALEVLARQRARNVLRQILAPFGSFRDPPAPNAAFENTREEAGL